jgi:hypothetical protein
VSEVPQLVDLKHFRWFPNKIHRSENWHIRVVYISSLKNVQKCLYKNIFNKKKGILKRDKIVKQDFLTNQFVSQNAQSIWKNKV